MTASCYHSALEIVMSALLAYEYYYVKCL